MKNFATVAFLLLFGSIVSDGKDTFIAKVIQIPTQEVEAFRSSLLDPANIRSAESISKAEQRRGVKIIASFQKIVSGMERPTAS